MILDNNYDQPMAATKECRPDPEEMLQNCRKRKGQYEKAKELIFELDGLPVSLMSHRHDTQNQWLETLGNIERMIHQLEKEIDNWLKEMDKD